MEKENITVTREERLEQVRIALAELDCALLDIQINRFELSIKDIPSVIEQLRRQIQNTRYKIWLWKG